MRAHGFKGCRLTMFFLHYSMNYSKSQWKWCDYPILRVLRHPLLKRSLDLNMDWCKQYKKAITFSYDDGNEQDIQLLKLFRKYGLKGTFNVNTGLNRNKGTWCYRDVLTVYRLNLEEQYHVYDGHEVAVHGRYHQNLTTLSVQEQREELQSDAWENARIFGKVPVGMAYAYGAYNKETLKLIRKMGIRYARNTRSNYCFSIQENLLEFCPTCHHDDPELFSLADLFLQAEPEKPQIFYIWGHSYEFEGKQNWDRIERFFEKIAGRSDIFYGTNQEVLLGGEISECMD